MRNLLDPQNQLLLDNKGKQVNLSKLRVILEKQPATCEKSDNEYKHNMIFDHQGVTNHVQNILIYPNKFLVYARFLEATQSFVHQ